MLASYMPVRRSFPGSALSLIGHHVNDQHDKQPGILMLTIRGLTKQIGGLRAVNSVDLSLGENEIVGLVGPNGAGKTTLLNMISGISPPDCRDDHVSQRRYYRVESGPYL